MDSDADALPSDPIYVDKVLAGYVTSASTGFRTEKRLAMGYLRNGEGRSGQKCEIEILGEKRPAIMTEPHFYDPENKGLKS